MHKLKCWRCNKTVREKQFTGGFKAIMHTLDPLNIDSFTQLSMPQPICKSCWKSFIKWSNERN